MGWLMEPHMQSKKKAKLIFFRCLWIHDTTQSSPGVIVSRYLKVMHSDSLIFFRHQSCDATPTATGTQHSAQAVDKQSLNVSELKDNIQRCNAVEKGALGNILHHAFVLICSLVDIRVLKRPSSTKTNLLNIYIGA